MCKSERNFQIEVAALFVNIFLIFYLRLSAFDTVLVLAASLAVLAAETFNTAIEKLCDFIQPEFDKKIGFIKDISAGAVMMTVILSAVVGVFVYWKYFFG